MNIIIEQLDITINDIQYQAKPVSALACYNCDLVAICNEPQVRNLCDTINQYMPLETAVYFIKTQEK